MNRDDRILVSSGARHFRRLIENLNNVSREFRYETEGVVYRKSLEVRETFHGIWPRSLSIIINTMRGVIMSGTYRDDAYVCA